MASRSRARAFAIQMLYCADIQSESVSARLQQIEQKLALDEELVDLDATEQRFIQDIEGRSSDFSQSLRLEHVQNEYIGGLRKSILSLYHAQLELPEEWYHEQRLSTDLEIAEYRSLLKLNIEPLDAYRLVSDKV